MRNRIIGTLAVATLALAGTACGGDDDGGSGNQGKVADMLIEALAEVETDGVTIDKDCIRDKASKLSDDDAKKIVEAGPDGDPDVSAEAEAIAESLFDCVEIGG